MSIYCPKCGQQQISEETRYCSRCGLLMTGVAQLVDGHGIIPQPPVRSGTSPRKRGLMQGLFFFLIGFLVVPLVTIFSIALDIEPYLVVILAITFAMGSVLRAAYALMFESAEPSETAALQPRPTPGQPAFETNAIKAGLLTTAAPNYDAPATGKWREESTIERRPGSVVENTTRLLEIDREQDQ